MSDKPTNFEIDDELLSAYLDGELSAEERAAVEARLATDPAAQQLLHELRSVSQSVQAMPTESLGRDLSEEILRRAREAKPALGAAAKSGTASQPSPFGDTIPKITVFGSKRAWIWASLALAAGLLIMVVQSGDKSKNKLPPVAQRDSESGQNQPADVSRKPVSREIAISAAPESAPPATTPTSDSLVQDRRAPAPGAAMPADGSGGQLRRGPSGGAAAGSPTASAEAALKKDMGNLLSGDKSILATAQPTASPADKPAAPLQPASRASGVAGSLGLDAQKQESESAVREQRRVVVRVVAKREALQKKSFDQLLADNKIYFDVQPAKDQPLTIGGGELPKQAESEIAAKSRSKKTDDGQLVEMVLVDAPASNIGSCLASLNKNSDDYLRIDVSEEPQSRDRADDKSMPTKNLGENFTRYSRGSVPQGQKDSVTLHDTYEFDKPNKQTVNGSPRAGGFGSAAGGQHETNGDEKWDMKRQSNPDMGRARRLQPSGPANRTTDEFSKSGRAYRTQVDRESVKLPAPALKLEEHAEAKVENKNDRWTVLFVLTPEDAAAPGAPPASPPK